MVDRNKSEVVTLCYKFLTSFFHFVIMIFGIKKFKFLLICVYEMGMFYVSFMGQFFMQMIIEYFPLNSLLISMANN